MPTCRRRTGPMSGVPSRSAPMPRQGEVWWFDPDPVRGHEEGGRRPCVVVSFDRLNRTAIGMIVVCPLTRSEGPRLLRIPLDPPEAGLSFRSFVQVEHVRSISIERVGMRIGRVGPLKAALIEDRLRRILSRRRTRGDPTTP